MGGRRCEVRSGPEFLLRKYSFRGGGRFHLVQFYYTDAQCRRPAFSVEARGVVRPLHPSWAVRGATELDYETTHVALVAYTDPVAAALQNTVNGTCRVRAADRKGPLKLIHTTTANPDNKQTLYQRLINVCKNQLV